MQTFLLEIWQGLLIALRAIGVHKMRAMLTTLGIIIGITAVTSMVTVINGLERGFDESLSQLGADVLYVQKWPWGNNSDWWRYINRPPLTEDLAEVIRTRSRYAEAVATSAESSRPAAFKGRTIAPVRVQGATPQYERVKALDLTAGRFYTEPEERAARNVVVLGADIAEGLFPVETPLGKTIRVGGRPFTVIGVLEKIGQGLDGQSQDQLVIVPFNTFKKFFGISQWRSIDILVKISSSGLVEEARDELTGLLRVARRLEASEEDDFAINEQQSLREQMAPVKTAIYGVGIFLTALSLLVGGIGVMNIMFVSVKERTREIGIRKAVGAKRRTILLQFLIEAVIICILGGALGVALALLLTVLINLVTPAFLPAQTVALAFVICIGIGVVFGLAPAWTAAKAEPIEALRYE